MYMMDYLMSLMGVLLSVAFFTLMERKVMGLTHYRKGPNKVIIWGISQPIADALKLLTKENSKMPATSLMMYILGPMLGLLVMLISWMWFEHMYESVSSSLKIMMILAMMGIVSYSLLLMSWGSNSKYSMLGGHRAIAQIMSYEVCMFLFIVIMASMTSSLMFNSMKEVQSGMWFMMFSIPTFLMWTTLCLAESNRTPFDMAEGESEIVSGFNIEYGGGLFAFIFISEYGMIMIMSFITSYLFLGGSYTLVKTMMFCLIYVWARTAMPRVRYDTLMMMSWKIMLPYSIAMMSLTSMMV